MSLGCHWLLYLLPVDHCHSHATGKFRFTPPLTAHEHSAVADEQKVARGRTVAASVPGFSGLAVGRTTFWDAVADYVGERATRPEAVSRIAGRYREWAAIFARGQAL